MITLFTPADLNRNLKMEDIDIDDISLYGDLLRVESREIINKSSFIIFMENEGNYRILKNRYADDSQETVEMLNMLNIL